MRSHSITVKALGAGLTTFSLIKAIKKLAALADGRRRKFKG
jgi:hypothetical protein